MRKVWLTALLAGLFVLLLGALVVTDSASVSVSETPVDPARFHAVLMPQPAPEAPCASWAIWKMPDWRVLAYTAVMLVLSAALPASACDSNGRVLSRPLV